MGWRVMASSERVQVLSERTRVPADGVSSTKICVRLPKAAGDSVSLRLTKLGSFDPEGQVREASFPVVDGEANLTVFAPKRPGMTHLLGPGIKQRLEFGAASHIHAVIYEWIPTLAWALVLALVLRNYAVASYFIPSSSMERTLLRGDLLIADKLSYKVLGQEPKRGDVMIFVFPQEQKKGKVDYIKRIIGLPGDTVEVRDEVVYVNGEPLQEPYIAEAPYTNYGPVVVPGDGAPTEYYRVAAPKADGAESFPLEFTSLNVRDYTGLLSPVT